MNDIIITSDLSNNNGRQDSVPKYERKPIAAPKTDTGVQNHGSVHR